MSYFDEFKELKAFVDNFDLFYKLLIENSVKFNITTVTDVKEVAIKHFIDSISAEKFINNGAKVVEIGSGGGFPSVPLKIVRRDIDFTLIEATAKKCEFLKTVKNELCFKNFSVICGRAEEIAHNIDFRKSFDFAVARAVAPLNSLSEYLLPFVKVGGKVIAFKGSNFQEEIDCALNAISILGGKLSDVFEYDLGNGFGKRALLIIEKISDTQDKFPRKEAKIRKQPL